MIKDARIVFMGTPEFAAPSLTALCENGYNVVGVISQPDKPVGRKHIIAPTPVKECALKLGIPVAQPERIKSEEGAMQLEAFAPDICVVAAFGQMLSQRNLDAPKLGMINIHGSLLPLYRGASPIQSAVLDGKKLTGVTIQQIGLAMDTGAVWASEEMEIGADMTSGELFDAMAKVSARLLIKTLPGIIAREITPIAQNEADATYCKMLKKEEAFIDWTQDAYMVHAKVRGMNPWPVAQCRRGDEILKIYKTRLIEGASGAPGSVITDGKTLAVCCGRGAVEILELQSPGGKRMESAAYLRGRPFIGGEALS